MESLEAAVSWAKAFAADDSHGYDQARRGTAQTDCSDLVCRALRAGGFDAPTPSFSTRTMGQWLESHGWVWHAGVGGVRSGDVLWMQGHTALAVSASQMVEAYPNGTPLSYDEPGDQNGREVYVAPIGTHRWAGYWRYEEDIVTPDDINAIAAACASYTWGDADKANNLNMYNATHWAYGYILELRAQLAALTEALKALASNAGADPDAVAKAVSDAVQAKLEAIDLKVEVSK